MAGTPRGLLRRNKFSQKHSTVIERARPLLKFAAKCDEITRVVSGDIACARGRVGISCKLNPTSVEVTVKGSGEIQVFYFGGTDLVKIQSLLDAWVKTQ